MSLKPKKSKTKKPQYGSEKKRKTKYGSVDYIPPLPYPHNKERKFKVGMYTRLFEEAGRYKSRSNAEDVAEKLGDRYYFRYTKVKGTYPFTVQLWKCKKPEWK